MSGDFGELWIWVYATAGRVVRIDHMAEGRWLSPREEHAWRSYLAFKRRLDNALVQHLQADFGLSAADYLVMVNLAEAPDGRMRTYELIEATQWEKSRLSHHLKRMERRRLVRRVPTENLRSPAFMLTENGETTIAEAAPAHAERVRRLFFDAVDPEFLDRFIDMCETVQAGIDRYSMGDTTPHDNP